MALDQIWTTGVPNDWEVAEANLLLSFFTGKGIDDYNATFTLDGVALDMTRDNALVACNGVTAMIATKPRPGSRTSTRSGRCRRRWATAATTPGSSA